jgi:hypothetical protein
MLTTMFVMLTTLLKMMALVKLLFQFFSNVNNQYPMIKDTPRLFPLTSLQIMQKKKGCEHKA